MILDLHGTPLLVWDKTSKKKIAQGWQHVTRAEVPLVGPDDRQFKIILLDADDTFDVIIHKPDGGREVIWSMIKDGEDAGRTTSDEDEGEPE